MPTAGWHAPECFVTLWHTRHLWTAAPSCTHAPQEDAPALKFITVPWPKAGDGLEAAAAAAPCPVLPFDGVLAAGRAARTEGGAGFAPHPADAQDLATLVYTSGTTGERGPVKLGRGQCFLRGTGQMQHGA